MRLFIREKIQGEYIMLSTIFGSIFATTATTISVGTFLLCIGVSLLTGLFLMFACTYKSKASNTFKLTLALLPAMVAVVIMMVNGNIGAGVAVAGAFSLVRFRSAPGTAKDIGTIFLAMGAGLMAGMGYLAYAALYAVIMGIVMLVCNRFIINGKKSSSADKTLRVTIPEDLDYTGVFDDIFERYATNVETIKVKTANMGSLYKLTYNLTLNDIAQEKKMLDEIRCRNGNLEVSMCRQEVATNEL